MGTPSWKDADPDNLMATASLTTAMAYRVFNLASASFMEREPGGVWSVTSSWAATKRFGGRWRGRVASNAAASALGAVWVSPVGLPQPWAQRHQESLHTVEKSKNSRERAPGMPGCQPALWRRSNFHCCLTLLTALSESAVTVCQHLSPCKETAQLYQEAQKSYNINSEHSPHLSSTLAPVSPVRDCGLRDFLHALDCRVVTIVGGSLKRAQACVRKGCDGFPVPSWTDRDIAPLNWRDW